MRLRWPLKVDRLAERLCSSPMSASTALYAGSFTGGSAGMAIPARAIRTASPKACALQKWWFLGRHDKCVMERWEGAEGRV